jgi:hypothetical protein
VSVMQHLISLIGGQRRPPPPNRVSELAEAAARVERAGKSLAEEVKRQREKNGDDPLGSFAKELREPSRHRRKKSAA